MSEEHTVLLIQFYAKDPNSRTYLDFDTVKDSMDALAQMYENHLKKERKEEGADFDDENGDLEYDWRALNKFMDEQIADLTIMIFDDVQKIYVPHGREWIRSRIFSFLRMYA